MAHLFLRLVPFFSTPSSSSGSTSGSLATVAVLWLVGSPSSSMQPGFLVAFYLVLLRLLTTPFGIACHFFFFGELIKQGMVALDTWIHGRISSCVIHLRVWHDVSPIGAHALATATRAAIGMYAVLTMPTIFRIRWCHGASSRTLGLVSLVTLPWWLIEQERILTERSCYRRISLCC